MIRTFAVSLLLLGAACGGAQGQASPAPAEGTGNGTLLPPGSGRLRQDDLALRFSAGDLEIRFVPLEERVLRLLTPDAYRALHDIRESRRTALDSAAHRAGISEPGLAMVTFFAARAGQRFEPQDLSLSVNGQEFRAAAIVPLSATFTSQQLENRQQASAIYVWELPLPVYQDFVLGYQGQQTDGWKDRVTTLTRETDRISLRVRASGADTTTARP